MDIQAWVWRNFDDISGISFLPYDDHTYKQAPYEECTEEVYNEKMKNFVGIKWENLKNYELEDTTIGGRDFACSGDVCEVVDLV